MTPSTPAPPHIAESVGRVVTVLLCGLLGHITNPCLPFCLACGKDEQ